MSHVGGFLGLEPASGKSAPPAGALALTSGRACLRFLLEQEKPAGLRVPFYICNAVLEAAAAANVSLTFYGLSSQLEPVAVEPLRRGEMLLAVDYFGVKGNAMAALRASLGARLVIDDTQAFFAKGSRDGWSFNSARKFFGVPDGAYLFGPWTGAAPAPIVNISAEHLHNARDGKQDLAFRQYREAEARIDTRVAGMSDLSARLLAAVDLERVASRRRDNFARLHARLGSRNTFALALPPDAAPYAYPFLPERALDGSRLAAKGIFVPVLWREVIERAGEGFARERDFATRMLPLPIDQRYGEEEMDRVCAVVEEESR